MLSSHPLREALHNEVHARPYERLTAPLALSHVALVGSQANAAWAHMVELLRKRHLPLPAEDANHLSVDLGGVHLRWEKHTEFHTCTFWKPLATAAPGPDAFDHTPITELPQDWLAGLPGEWLVDEAVPSADRDERDIPAKFFARHPAFGGRYACHTTSASTTNCRDVA